jgi:beta-mannosidase
MELLTAYLEKEDLTPHSYAFRAHEKQTGGLELLRALLAVHYPVPEDLRLFVLYSQLNQGDALKTAVTHWRSRMFRTSGCLIWQLNDCWPVISWSLIDYGLNPKAAYYSVKRACQPIIAPLIIKHDTVEGYVINETDTQLEAAFRFEVMTFSGEVLFSLISGVSVPAYTSKRVLQTELDKLPRKENCIFVATLNNSDGVLAEDARTVVEPKDLKLPPPQIQVAAVKVGAKTFEISFQSQSYVKALTIGLRDQKVKLSDNFFDLLPNRKKVIICHLELEISTEQLEKALNYQSYPYT